MRRRNPIGAAESFIDAIFDENLKRVQGSPLNTKATDNIEEIFLKYQINLGG